MNDRQKQISEIIQKVVKKELSLGLEDKLDTVVTSSLTFVIILGEIENTFDIEIPEAEMETENFKDILSIDNTIERVLSIES